MGQDFVKFSPRSFDTLSDLEFTHDLLGLDHQDRQQHVGLRSSALRSRAGGGGDGGAGGAGGERSNRGAGGGVLSGTTAAVEREHLDHMLSAVSSSRPHLEMLHAKSITRVARQGGGQGVVGQRQSLQRESLYFMKGVMDECTHIANFSGGARSGCQVCSENAYSVLQINVQSWPNVLEVKTVWSRLTESRAGVFWTACEFFCQLYSCGKSLAFLLKH